MNSSDQSKKQQALCRTAAELFSQRGWVRVSIEEICAAAGVSRVTFYKYFPNKKALLCRLITDHKNEIRASLTHVQTHANTLEEALNVLFDWQRRSLATLYSEAMLHDMRQNRDEGLRHFFETLEQEKYGFMRGFFTALQQRRLIRTNLPAALIDAFIRQLDVLIQQEAVLEAYAEEPQQLLKDALQLLIYGLAYRPG